MNLTVKELKQILAKCPDDMDVIMPVIDEDDNNHILGFRHLRTAGILSTPGTNDALCLNTSTHGLDISRQIHREDVKCKKVLK